ncbi:MAG: hypothetical protein ACR2M1_03400 [Gemmatimonadaceae bacterium]
MAHFKSGSQAVFSRNWDTYLKAAMRRAKSEPARPTVFQSRARWVSGRSASPCKIYFVANHEDEDDAKVPKIRYVADLVEVRVDPTKKDAT